jgi:hypothetical protein
MTKLVAVNDLKIKCGNSSFRECSVTLRRNAIFPDQLPSKLTISMLIKPSFLWHKNTVICYCDGIIVIQKEIPIIKQKEEQVIEEDDDYREDPDVEDPFSDYNLVEKMDLAEEIEETYQKEKHSWIHRFSKNENLVEAINLEYDCDEVYCKERIEQEYPGFMIVDHTTYFWKAKCPSLKAINIEKRLMMQVNGFKAKYGTYIRIVELEKHQGVEYNDQEAIVIFNYLNKFEVIGLVSVVEQTVYGRQLECNHFGSEVLSN